MTNETFGQRLRRLREEKGWTQEELSQKANPIHSLTVKRIEDGQVDETAMYVYSAKKICNALDVSMDYLYAGVEPSPTSNTPGKRIRARRDELGWSLDRIVSESNISEDSIKDIETDAIESSIKNAARFLAYSLGVTPEWILTGAEPKFPQKAPNAPWFLGFGDEPGIEFFNGQNIEVVTVDIHIKKGYAAKVLELIRTGRPIE